MFLVRTRGFKSPSGNSTERALVFDCTNYTPIQLNSDFCRKSAASVTIG